MNENNIFNFQQELLQKEISTILSKISDYDELSFKIKSWAVTLWSVIIVLGADRNKLVIVALSIVVVIAFWFLDTFFKIYQRRSMARMGIIEDFINSRNEFAGNGLSQAFINQTFGNFPIHDPISRITKIQNKEFAKRYSKKTSFWTCFFLNNVSVLYIALIVATSVVLLLKFSQS